MNDFHPEEIPELLGPDGPLAKGVSRYEDRPYQRELALEVARLLEEGGRLAAEAPTGIGKSLAYAVPAAAWAAAGNGPVVISTHTKALQRQLVELEAPRLKQAISKDLSVVVLKGRANYLCRRRYRAALREASDKTLLRLLHRIEGWVETTKSGDLSECGVRDPQGQRLLALHVASDRGFCSHPECTAQEGCFFKKARLRAGAADLLVVNHALLALHLFRHPDLLPSFDALIVDEAHAFLRVALDQLTIVAGPGRLAALMERAPGESGILPAVVRAALGETRLAALRQSLERAGIAVRAYFGKDNGKPEAAGTRLRYRDAEGLRSLCPLSPDAVVEALRGLHADALSLRGWLERAAEGDGMEGFLAETDRFAEEAEAFLADLEQLLEPDPQDRERVYWKQWEGKDAFSLRASPVTVGEDLSQALENGPERLIFTSATLAAGKDSGYFARETGLEGSLHTIVYPSPFDFTAQALAVGIRGGPDPRQPGWVRIAAETLDALLVDPGRKTLALFTSYADLEKVHAALRSRGADERALLLAQGSGGNAQTLLEEFRGAERALLLGTASFWEGVDLPGDHLEVLVLARLPLGIPTDPRYEARAEALLREGRNPFYALYVPEAVLRFKQGFGRLIRRRSDRGIVAVLDPRLFTQKYGRRFMEALPLPVTPVPDGPALARAAAQWWNRHGEADHAGGTKMEPPPGGLAKEPDEEGETT